MYRVVLVVLFLTGCATTGSTTSSAAMSPLLSMGWSPAPGQSCTLMGGPGASLDAATFIDNDAVQASLGSAQVEDVAGPSDHDRAVGGYGVLEVFFDSAGERTGASVVESNLDADAQRALLAAVTDRVAASTASSWGVLLRVEAGEPATTTIGEVEYCACALTNRREVVHELQQSLRSVNNGRLEGTTHRVAIHVRSDTLGNILEVRQKELSEYPEVNSLVLRLVSRMNVAPPLLNRRPQDRWSAIPFTIVFPRLSPPKPPREGRR